MTALFGAAMTYILLGFLLFSLSGGGSVECLGINYGQVANNLPPPQKVLDLLEALKVRKARIYDTNPEVLRAFGNSGTEIIVTVENEMVATLMDEQAAMQWVSSRIRPYIPATKITGIAVGNEVFSGDDTALVSHIVPAILSIHAALVRLGLDQTIQVSTPNSLAVLAVSYPPSAGTFSAQLDAIMPQFLQFLQATKGTFWINAYPYFAYKDDPSRIPLDYVLLNPDPAQGMTDPYTNLHYDNMLYAQVDAVIFAMARMGFQGIQVGVSETGWPSKGDQDETGATLQNAAVYNRNIMRRQSAGQGTPLRPTTSLEIYVFALFNEDMKPGPTSERNYGLFHPDGTMAYNVGLLSTTSGATTPSSASVSFTSSSAKQAPHGGFIYSTILLLKTVHFIITRQI